MNGMLSEVLTRGGTGESINRGWNEHPARGPYLYIAVLGIRKGGKEESSQEERKEGIDL